MDVDGLLSGLFLFIFSVFSTNVFFRKYLIKILFSSFCCSFLPFSFRLCAYAFAFVQFFNLRFRWRWLTLHEKNYDVVDCVFRFVFCQRFFLFRFFSHAGLEIATRFYLEQKKTNEFQTLLKEQKLKTCTANNNFIF